MNPFSALAIGLAWLGMVGISWLGWQLLRQNGRLLLRLDELEKRLDTVEFGENDQPTGLLVGSDAPGFELPDLAGERKSLAQYRGQAVLLIFFNPGCGFCRDLAPKLVALTGPADTLSHPVGDGRGEGVPLPLILTTGGPQENRQFFAEHNINCPVLLQKDTEVAKAYQANGTPGGYLISPDGKIVSQLAMGSDALLALASGRSTQPTTPNPQTLDQNSKAPTATNWDQRTTRFGNRSLAHSKIKRDGLKPGTRAPAFRLQRLDGRGELALQDFLGRPVLLVFSSPHCGPCNALAPELQKFHREHLELEVVMISKGEPKENRAKVKEHCLTFPVVLQQQWEISRQYAMFATPIAYFIDDAGLIVYDVAVGTGAIVELMTKAGSQAGSAESSPGMVVEPVSTHT
jgi:peroxiredoxin